MPSTVERLEQEHASGKIIKCIEFENAARAGDISALKWLTSMGVDSSHSWATYHAVIQGQRESVDYLIQTNHRFNGNELQAAVETGQTELFRLLLAAGAPLNGNEARIAVARGDLSVLNLLPKDALKWKGTEMEAAAWAGHHHILGFLKAHGLPWTGTELRRADERVVSELRALGYPFSGREPSSIGDRIRTHAMLGFGK